MMAQRPEEESKRVLGFMVEDLLRVFQRSYGVQVQTIEKSRGLLKISMPGLLEAHGLI